MSWLPPQRKLDAAQKKAIGFVTSNEGNYFICGEAGTGKSVVLAYVAKAYKEAHPQSKICALTYTKALVACLTEELSKFEIPVMGFHKFMGSKDCKDYDLILIDEDARRLACLAEGRPRVGRNGTRAQSLCSCELYIGRFCVFGPEWFDMPSAERVSKSGLPNVIELVR